MIADQINKILVIQPDHIGDVLLATPMISSLRRRFPRARIDAVVGTWAKPVLASNPDLNNVYTFNLGYFNRQREKSPASLRTFWKLRSNRYDLAVMARSRNRVIRLLAWAIGAKQRIGFKVPGKDSLLTIKIRQTEPREHVVRRNLRLAEHFDAETQPAKLVWKILESERQFAAQFLKDLPRPLIGLNPGAGTAAKKWPAARFATVARELQRKHNASLIITGGPADRSIAEKISGSLEKPAVITAGRTNLRQLAAILARLNLYISNDSGPMHIAAAVGTPVIDLHSGTDYPSSWRPWGPQHIVLTHASDCPKFPCRLTVCDTFQHGCLEKISTHDVLAAAEKYLKATTAG